MEYSVCTYMIRPHCRFFSHFHGARRTSRSQAVTVRTAHTLSNMGKSRREKARPRRADPLAKAVKLPSDPELAALREAQILPVLKDLQKPDAKSRTAAASAVANIVQDAKCRKLLLREQIVPIVMGETLTDTSIDSRAAGWEILKVLAEEEESDFCVHLYRIDILTAIEHAAKSVSVIDGRTESCGNPKTYALLTCRLDR